MNAPFQDIHTATFEFPWGLKITFKTVSYINGWTDAMIRVNDASCYDKANGFVYYKDATPLAILKALEESIHLLVADFAKPDDEAETSPDAQN